MDKWYTPKYFGRGPGYYHLKVIYYGQDISVYSGEAETDHHYYDSVSVRHPIPIHYLSWLPWYPSLDDSPPTHLGLSVDLFLLAVFYIAASIFLLRKFLFLKHLISNGRVVLGRVVEVQTRNVSVEYKWGGKVYGTVAIKRMNDRVGDKAVVLVDGQNPKMAMVYDERTILRAMDRSSSCQRLGAE